MTNATRAALEQAEPIDPEHYFAKVSIEGQQGPEYGLVDAQLPLESAPLELDEARVTVAERVDDADEFGARPVLTVMFEGVDDLEIEASEADEEEIAPDEAHIELLVADDKEAVGGIPNSVAENPRDASAIIKRAMRKRRLDRVTTSPDDVYGLSSRYVNAANFLLEAGFHKLEGSDSEDSFELVGEPIEREQSDSDERELAEVA